VQYPPFSLSSQYDGASMDGDGLSWEVVGDMTNRNLLWNLQNAITTKSPPRNNITVKHDG
ncbi:hypothetical protein HDU80_004131, partial [Chytriomyces hyalinus]